MTIELPDVQKTEPDVKLPIQRVGISDVKLPIYIDMIDGGKQHTVAEIDICVDLESDKKGIHMSRLQVGLYQFRNTKLDRRNMIEIAKIIMEKCEAETCQLKYRFPYFMDKKAPESGVVGKVYADVEFDVTVAKDKEPVFRMVVGTITTSLCPCSKEIGESGAHNQRSKIRISCEVNPNQFIWIEDLVKISEESSSCEVYSILKRPDEKYVTDKAYDNPAFVEDAVRTVYQKLSKLESIFWYKVEVTNYESIHQHNAYAMMKTY